MLFFLGHKIYLLNFFSSFVSGVGVAFHLFYSCRNVFAVPSFIFQSSHLTLTYLFILTSCISFDCGCEFCRFCCDFLYFICPCDLYSIQLFGLLLLHRIKICQVSQGDFAVFSEELYCLGIKIRKIKQRGRYLVSYICGKLKSNVHDEWISEF